MKLAIAVLAILPLACASSAEASPDTVPKPPQAEACKPSGKVVFEIDHRATEGAKLDTYAVKVFGTGAWTRQNTDADGKASPQTAGCLDKAYAKDLAHSLRSVPWKVTTAQIHCMAVSPQFTEYRVDGKLVFTQKLCSGQNLDDKSRAALDAAVAKVEDAANPAP